MPIAEFHKPDTLQAAVGLLSRTDLETKPAAGCTDLSLQLAGERPPATRVVSLSNIPELNGIRSLDPDHLFIGATTPHAVIAADERIQSLYPALAKASGLVGAPAIRNVGTIGGNICTASPSADTAPPLLAYNARVSILTSKGEIQLPLSRFFAGPRRTCLQPDGIVTGLVLSVDQNTRSDFEKLGQRRAMEIAIVNIAIALRLSGSGLCENIRIALGAVAPTPVRAHKAETLLQSQPLTARRIQEAAAVAGREVAPISDIRASEAYRRRMVRVLVRQMLTRLAAGFDSQGRGAQDG